jgi:hypothetical protein
MLRGAIEVEPTDGTKRRFGPADLVLAPAARARRSAWGRPPGDCRLS